MILPPPPAGRPRAPRPSPFIPGVYAPARSRCPALPPPPLDALAMDDEWLAFCDAERDEARDVQDADPDAEWADLPEWMHRPVGGVALGIGEVVDGRLVWTQPARGDA